jgi:hypothetical protein
MPARQPRSLVMAWWGVVRLSSRRGTSHHHARFPRKERARVPGAPAIPAVLTGFLALAVARLEPPLIPRLYDGIGTAVDRLAGLGRIKLAAIVTLAAGNLCAVLQPDLSAGAVLTQAAIAGLACYLPLLWCALASAAVQTLAGQRGDGRAGRAGR